MDTQNPQGTQTPEKSASEQQPVQATQHGEGQQTPPVSYRDWADI